MSKITHQQPTQSQVENPMFLESGKMHRTGDNKQGPTFVRFSREDTEDEKRKHLISPTQKIIMGIMAFLFILSLALLKDLHTSEVSTEDSEEDGEPGRVFTGPAIAVTHGMGDSCYNPGMRSIVKLIQDQMPNSYVECIIIGNNFEEDTINAFALPMNGQVDLFAERINANPSFKNGFKAIGLSQGNLLIRGYIQRYSQQENYPTISSFVSIHGPLLGVSAFPGCDPTDITGIYCELMDSLSSDLAYSRFFQANLAQANYYRDPLLLEEYMKTKFLPVLNKENGETNEEIAGLESLDQLVLVKAEEDIVVAPKESEWFGYLKDGSREEMESFQETKFYTEDLFGLKTLDEQGKVFFESTPGDHLQFTNTYLINLIETYWKEEM